MPVLGIAVGVLVGLLRPLFRLMQGRIDRINAVLREQIAGIRVVRAFAREDHERRRFAATNREFTDVSVRIGSLFVLMFPVITMILHLATAAVLRFGGHRVGSGQIQVGSLTAFLQHLLQILTAVMMGTFMVMMVPRAMVCAGRITLDGVDITDLSRAELRSRAGMVLQDAWLFGGSIRENIRHGRLDATDEEVLEAARATFVDRFVRALPEGSDTVIDPEGSSVSVGERQLITIARAFLSDPSLLILDEATSSVDTRTELLVQQAMAALRSDRTSFVIAHRLSTVRDADIILVMEDGRIVEQGAHDDLLAARGAYAALHASQFAAPAVPDDAPTAHQSLDVQESTTHDTP